MIGDGWTVKSLLMRLLDETERARDQKILTQAEEFDTLLDSRSELLEELERSVHALAQASDYATRTRALTSRESLIALASELARANTMLMDSARAEQAVLAAAIAAADRPDAVASRYGQAVPREAPHLNRMH